jgi:hypothetical protein
MRNFMSVAGVTGVPISRVSSATPTYKVSVQVPVQLVNQ